MVVVKLKSLGVVSKFVGIGFVYDKESGWRLEQRQAILELLEKFGLSSATPVLVPVGGEQEDEAEGELLQSGGRRTPAAADRADILVASRQSVLDCPLHLAGHCVCGAPGDPVLSCAATRRVAAYQGDRALLEGTLNFDFMMKATPDGVIAGEVVLEAYSDADYAGDRVDRKSVSGGVMLVGCMVVGWICKKQASISLSTMEAEFVAAFQVTAEMFGIAELLKEIGVKVKDEYDLKVHNQAAIKQIKGENTSGRAKHIDIRYKFVNDLARKKALRVVYCESKSMRSDILTKSMPAPRIEGLRGLVMLTP
ncbi:hypothetical protein PF008_g574 [Phytophthora fragariae]|uniref:Reverse transcriptase Ty1/copia-type domain-containing protein n=1 Tax=Phytophthora fragariae TaxID=53985 RepID=A0A6G0SNP2_9STRA|nr:hypothetical protein PF008_g574 [Phytophthora fragariae]